jgi:O-antigen biosynthesis protein
MPEWILLILFLFFLTGIGLHWSQLFVASFFLVFAILVPVMNAFLSAHATLEWTNGSTGIKRFKKFVVCALLHSVQTFARFTGRWPLWRPAYKRFVFPVRKKVSVWNERYQDSTSKLSTLLELCRDQGAIVACGGVFDRWDLETKGGAFGSARLLMAVEEHGNGKQMNRFLVYPYAHWVWRALIGFVLILASIAALHSAWISVFLLAGFSLLVGGRILLETGRSVSAFISSIRLFEEKAEG